MYHNILHHSVAMTKDKRQAYSIFLFSNYFETNRPLILPHCKHHKFILTNNRILFSVTNCNGFSSGCANHILNKSPGEVGSSYLWSPVTHISVLTDPKLTVVTELIKSNIIKILYTQILIQEMLNTVSLTLFYN